VLTPGAKAWEAASLPDDPADFTQYGEVSSDVPMLLLPRPVVAAAAEMVAASRLRGITARRAAMMIAEPHAPGGHTRAKRDPAVRRWVRIIDQTFFLFVHAFDKKPAPVTEGDLNRDFAFLEEVMRGVLAALGHTRRSTAGLRRGAPETPVTLFDWPRCPPRGSQRILVPLTPAGRDRRKIEQAE
jgi:hypothetical protein